MAVPHAKTDSPKTILLPQAQAAGYFYSILFMMAMPFVLLGTLGGAAYLSIRRAREQQVTSLEKTVPSDTMRSSARTHSVVS